MSVSAAHRPREAVNGNNSWSEDAELLELTALGHYKTIDTVNGVEVAPATA